MRGAGQLQTRTCYDLLPKSLGIVGILLPGDHCRCLLTHAPTHPSAPTNTSSEPDSIKHTISESRHDRHTVHGGSWIFVYGANLVPISCNPSPLRCIPEPQVLGGHLRFDISGFLMSAPPREHPWLSGLNRPAHALRAHARAHAARALTIRPSTLLLMLLNPTGVDAEFLLLACLVCFANAFVPQPALASRSKLSMSKHLETPRIEMSLETSSLEQMSQTLAGVVAVDGGTREWRGSNTRHTGLQASDVPAFARSRPRRPVWRFPRHNSRTPHPCRLPRHPVSGPSQHLTACPRFDSPTRSRLSHSLALASASHSNYA